MEPAIVVVVKRNDSTKSESTKRTNVTNRIRVLVIFFNSTFAKFIESTTLFDEFVGPLADGASSDEDEPHGSNHLGYDNGDDEGRFIFKRNKPCMYQRVRMIDLKLFVLLPQHSEKIKTCIFSL